MSVEMRTQGRVSGAGPWVHNKGRKAEKDRAVLLTSYREMCRVFRVPKSRRLSERDIAIMTNAQVYQASKDLYNGATVKQARRLAERLGVVSRGPSILQRFMAGAGKMLRGYRVEGRSHA